MKLHKNGSAIVSNVSGPQGPEFQGPQQPYLQNGGFVPPMPPARPPKKRRTGLKVIGGIVGAIVVLVILVNAFGGGGVAPSGTAAVDQTAPSSQPSDLGTCCTGTVDPSTTTTRTDKKAAPKPKPKATKQPVPKPKPKATHKAEPQYTTAQEEAIESAESYLEMGGFSKKGLIEQLSSNYGEGFDKADAKFAVNHVKVDWNHQAVLSAESYLEMGGMSESALVEQLHSPYGEQFTLAQAQHGAHYAYTHR